MTKSQPLLLTTWKFGRTANSVAWPALSQGGTAIDACELVCRVIEKDPAVDSVGYGGLPDFDGDITVDAAIMLAPDRVGSVCAVRNVLHPITLARRVMEKTPHILLAGEGARDFARREKLEFAELRTEETVERWRRYRFGDQTIEHSGEGGHIQPLCTGEWPHDTVSVIARDQHGTICAASSTSGLAFKRPGRVGDSPIVGHGLYVDPQVGACVATGAGELVMGTCTSFLVVEAIRRGASVTEALLEGLSRIEKSFELKREYQVALVALSARGEWSTAALRPAYKTCVRTLEGEETLKPHTVLLPEESH